MQGGARLAAAARLRHAHCRIGNGRTAAKISSLGPTQATQTGVANQLATSATSGRSVPPQRRLPTVPEPPFPTRRPAPNCWELPARLAAIASDRQAHRRRPAAGSARPSLSRLARPPSAAKVHRMRPSKPSNCPVQRITTTCIHHAPGRACGGGRRPTSRGQAATMAPPRVACRLLALCLLLVAGHTKVSVLPRVGCRLQAGGRCTPATRGAGVPPVLPLSAAVACQYMHAPLRGLPDPPGMPVWGPATHVAVCCCHHRLQAWEQHDGGAAVLEAPPVLQPPLVLRARHRRQLADAVQDRLDATKAVAEASAAYTAQRLPPSSPPPPPSPPPPVSLPPPLLSPPPPPSPPPLLPSPPPLLSPPPPSPPPPSPPPPSPLPAPAPAPQVQPAPLPQQPAPAPAPLQEPAYEPGTAYQQPAPAPQQAPDFGITAAAPSAAPGPQPLLLPSPALPAAPSPAPLPPRAPSLSPSLPPAVQPEAPAPAPLWEPTASTPVLRLTPVPPPALSPT